MTKMPLQMTPREIDSILGFLADGFCLCEMLTDAQKTAAGAAPDTVRLSVGIEDAADIIADLDQALAAL